MSEQKCGSQSPVSRRLGRRRHCQPREEFFLIKFSQDSSLEKKQNKSEKYHGNFRKMFTRGSFRTISAPPATAPGGPSRGQHVTRRTDVPSRHSTDDGATHTKMLYKCTRRVPLDSTKTLAEQKHSFAIATPAPVYIHTVYVSRSQLITMPTLTTLRPRSSRALCSSA